MFTITAAQLAKLADMFDLEDDDIRTDYEGRGMYGKKCLGIVLQQHNIDLNDAIVTFELAVLIMDQENAGPFSISELRTVFYDLSPSEDSMGLDQIIYWKNVTVEE